ncbi:MAG: hypothetical protein QNK23_01780 [Crocinitomicaceae bacterium]|nr:hypothetical protein [Crocinitomicaceae bacterium]
MQQKFKYIQLGLEAIIPLSGFFFWDWSLYFILLFYFIDILVGEVIAHLKSGQVAAHHGGSTDKLEWIRKGLISGVVLLIGIAIIHIAMMFIAQGINFQEEIVAFWTYKEMGVQQGFLLVPLVAFAGYQQYKMEFLMPAKYRTTTITAVWKPHTQALLIILAFAGLCAGLVHMVQIPEVVYVLGIVIVSFGYRFNQLLT